MPLSMPPSPAPRARQPWRARILLAAFELLYGPLAGLHEMAGRILFGKAWHARRRSLIEQAPLGDRFLDIGCGDGRLLAEIAEKSRQAVGVDPSLAVARRAARRGVTVARAMAQALPFRDGVFDTIVSSYPGPWIVDARVWDNIARVARPGATVVVLLGGDYVRGPFARHRMIVARLAYGRSDNHPELAQNVLPLGNEIVQGKLVRQQDPWGTAILWIGTRAESGSLL